jgi:hypothetical protein
MAFVACAVTALAGCSSTAPLDADRASRLLADHIPPWAGGEPSSVPSPQTPPQPLNVFDTPPARPVKPLDAAEQKKLQSDLVALRNRTHDRAKAAWAVDPPDLPLLAVDRHNRAEEAAASPPGAASHRNLDGPS